MKIMRFGQVAAAAVVGSLSLAACGGQQSTPAGSGGASGTAGGATLSGSIVTDGSSTVGPLTSAAAELFMTENKDVKITVGTSGTGGGFKKFCAGQTAVSNASRPIKDEEKELCAKNGVEFQEIIVANDALSVVVNKENTFLSCVKVDELKKLWEPAATGKVMKWSDVNAAWPAEAVKLYGPGTDSGTFDYFTKEINGEEGASRTDYSPSEDDNIIVQGVSGDKNAMGYFGFTYFEENADKLKVVQVDDGKGCVTPTADTARDGSYSPLSRPLFIYVSKKEWAKPEVKAFVKFYVENDATIAEAAKYVGLSEDQKKTASDEIAKLG